MFSHFPSSPFRSKVLPLFSLTYRTLFSNKVKHSNLLFFIHTLHTRTRIFQSDRFKSCKFVSHILAGVDSLQGMLAFNQNHLSPQLCCWVTRLKTIQKNVHVQWTCQWVSVPGIEKHGYKVLCQSTLISLVGPIL